ncbi:MAG: hypothetical protein Q9184_003565 [Pyrenodesmia sp. 2 TL-2023]
MSWCLTLPSLLVREPNSLAEQSAAPVLWDEDIELSLPGSWPSVGSSSLKPKDVMPGANLEESSYRFSSLGEILGFIFAPPYEGHLSSNVTQALVREAHLRGLREGEATGAAATASEMRNILERKDYQLETVKREAKRSVEVATEAIIAGQAAKDEEIKLLKKELKRFKEKRGTSKADAGAISSSDYADTPGPEEMNGEAVSGNTDVETLETTSAEQQSPWDAQPVHGTPEVKDEQQASSSTSDPGASASGAQHSGAGAATSKTQGGPAGTTSTHPDVPSRMKSVSKGQPATSDVPEPSTVQPAPQTTLLGTPADQTKTGTNASDKTSALQARSNAHPCSDAEQPRQVPTSTPGAAFSNHTTPSSGLKVALPPPGLDATSTPNGSKSDPPPPQSRDSTPPVDGLDDGFDGLDTGPPLPDPQLDALRRIRTKYNPGPVAVGGVKCADGKAIPNSDITGDPRSNDSAPQRQDKMQPKEERGSEEQADPAGSIANQIPQPAPAKTEPTTAPVVKASTPKAPPKAANPTGPPSYAKYGPQPGNAQVPLLNGLPLSWYTSDAADDQNPVDHLTAASTDGSTVPPAVEESTDTEMSDSDPPTDPSSEGEDVAISDTPPKMYAYIAQKPHPMLRGPEARRKRSREEDDSPTSSKIKRVQTGHPRPAFYSKPKDDFEKRQARMKRDKSKDNRDMLCDRPSHDAYVWRSMAAIRMDWSGYDSE